MFSAVLIQLSKRVRVCPVGHFSRLRENTYFQFVHCLSCEVDKSVWRLFRDGYGADMVQIMFKNDMC